ncbi:hypothetical protein Aperf_G00000095366 [Anoplocephala perfoliata]
MNPYMLMLLMGPNRGVSVSRESLNNLLDASIRGESGNLVAVLVGGAREALESRPGHYVFVLSRRQGFFRIALKTGSYLVPTIGFGEPNMFDQVDNPKGSRLRKLQDWLSGMFVMSFPLFYSTRLIPYRRPLTIVDSHYLRNYFYSPRGYSAIAVFSAPWFKRKYRVL